MTLQPSHSDSAAAFELLHPGIREWIWDQQWKQMRSVQVQAIPAVLAGTDDVIITAATAGGKTEAAWLPICSAIGQAVDAGTAGAGIKAVCISPLKALINDQYERLRVMAGYVNVPVVRRHGDVTGAEREALRRAPDGIVLITPESLEALFVLQGSHIPRWFAGLQYVVVDELHAFMGTERGAQLQSLLHRLEQAVGKRVPRVALSATLADTRIAAEFLRPGDGGSATLVAGKADEGAELRMQLRGYEVGREVDSADGLPGLPEGGDSPEQTSDHEAFSQHIYDNLRGKDNLIFANSRSAVELYADSLTRMCDEQRVFNEFYPHHGSLARELREDVEAKLKAGDTPTTAICTSTLEMGIDIGSVDSIAQIGPPPSVASLRQRVGRSGRRGGPAVLRVYVSEDRLDSRSGIADQLRSRVVQSIAMLDLMLQQWFEHPDAGSLHLSTLVQQVLSVIGQHGGASAQDLYGTLCQQGPFARVSTTMFRDLLRTLGAKDVLMQAGDGLLLPGLEGERILNHYSFYAAFHTPLDYRLVTNGTTLGSMPLDFPVQEGDLLIFAGQRWRILRVDVQSRVIELARSGGGKPPLFGGRGASVADRVRQEMRAVLMRTDEPVYLDAPARRLLGQGREAFGRLQLAERSMIAMGTGVVLVPWCGDLALNTLKVWLSSVGFEVEVDRLVLVVSDTTTEILRSQLERLVEASVDGLELASAVLVKEVDKYDGYLDEGLLNHAYAARNLDVPAARIAVQRLLAVG